MAMNAPEAAQAQKDTDEGSSEGRLSSVTAAIRTLQTSSEEAPEIGVSFAPALTSAAEGISTRAGYRRP